MERPGAGEIGIAIDDAERIFVDNGNQQIDQLTATGEEIGPLTHEPNPQNGAAPPTGLAVDQLSGDVYIDTGKSIAHLSHSCNPQAGFCPVEETFGAPELTAGKGLAVDSTDDVVYAADSAAATIRSYTKALEVDTGAPGAITAATATVNGSINPEGSPATGCHFEYGETEEYGQEVPCAGPAELTEPAQVNASLTGLHGGTTYHYRLVAQNTGGVVYGEDATLTTPTTPTIAAAAAANLTRETAELDATINPHGIPVTACTIEYGTDTGYGHSAACEQTPGEIGAGNSPVPVSLKITGLKHDITYHWRILATDENGVAASTDHTFIYTTLTATLPDGRQYELVTPVQKNGALIGKLFSFIPPQISTDGTRLVAATDQCFPGATSCVGDRQNDGEPYEFERTNTGWTSKPLAPPAATFQTSSYWSFNPDAQTALFSAPSPPAGQDDFYRRDAAGTFTDIGPIGEGPQLGSYETLTKEGMLSTADLSHIVFEALTPAWSFDHTEGEGASSLYEYAGTATAPLLVGVTGPQGSHNLISRCGTRLGNREQGFSKLYRSLSQDGRTVFFVVRRCESAANEGVEIPAAELYARIDGERGDAHTVQVSAPTTPGCTTSECKENTSVEKQAERARDASYEGASADGSTVFFTDTQQLTDSASQDPATNDTAFACAATVNEGSGCNLYASSCPFPCPQPATERTLTDISANAHGGPRVQATLAITPDGSHIYFVAKGALTETPNQQGKTAHNGAENLYVYERDPAFPQGRLRFIAALSEGDLARPGSANVTPDGARLVFLSRRGLTPDATRTEGPAQVYEYEAESGTLTRLSIGQDGFNDNGNGGVGAATLVGAFHADEATSVPQRSDPTMSDNGAYIYFQSPVALTPHALNDVETGALVSGESVYAENVYEYHDGNVSLISDGSDTSLGAGEPPHGVELLGTDATGTNVFFSTADQLVKQDTDTQLDIYDAHLCSSEQPCLPAGAEPPQPCEGEACHPTAGAPAAQPSPGSATFSGTGNLPPPGPAKAKPPTRAQKLTKALRHCRAAHKRKRPRNRCETQARTRYGPTKAAKKTSNTVMGSHARRSGGHS